VRVQGAAIVLGAGASKGAQIGGGRTPPLDAEFLEVAGNYFSRKRARGPDRERVLAWNSFKAHLKSAGLDFTIVKKWRLEQLSTFLEARANLHTMQLSQGRPRDYLQALESLKTIVCHALDVEGGTKSCELHKRLFDHVIPSAVLTFNYDLIADQSLLALSRLNWRKAEYRCAAFASHPVEGGGDAYVRLWPGPERGTVPLLKLHGSMHYQELGRGSGFRLAGAEFPTTSGDLFRYVKVPTSPYIIPPIAAKIQIQQQELRARWNAALDYLHDAKVWIIWGYSFPTTDTISHVLFRTALARNRKSKPVIVVNPDSLVANRVVDVCQKVKVEHYSSMERFLLDRHLL
jgi:hypothetical protein